MMKLLMHGGTIFNYGSLTKQPRQIHPVDAIFKEYTFKGLYLITWLLRKPYEERMNIGKRVQELLENVFLTEYSSEYPLSLVQDAFASYLHSSTDNKISIKISI